jgi:hypothetical protein
MGEEEREQAPPQVSVLVVSEDNAPALRRCLQALEGSVERERFEILVIDNGSQDESPRLDTEFPGATFLRLPRRFGVVKALNIGMRTAKGEFFPLSGARGRGGPGDGLEAGRLSRRRVRRHAVCPLLVDAEGKPSEQFYRLPDAAGALRAARRGRWEPVTAPKGDASPWRSSSRRWRPS